MAFQLGTIDFLVKELLPRIKHKGSVVSLARQFITSNPKNVRAYLAKAGLRTKIDGYQWDRAMTSRELFLAFGFDRYDDIDFNDDEGCNIIHDLNRPIPAQYHGQYDLVFEAGTLEHLFDIRTAFENIMRLVKVGGTIFHFSPLTWINHGFYNFSLTVFYDAYRANGFKDIELYLVAFPTDWVKNQSISYQKTQFIPQQINVTAPEGAYMIVSCIATKDKELEEFRVPIQAAYDPALKLKTPLKQFA